MSTGPISPLNEAPGFQPTGFDWRSETTLLGLPLIHISWGLDENRRKRVSKGIIAIGQYGSGGLVIAQFGAGIVCISQFGVGVVAITQFGVALAAISQFGVAVAGIFQFGVCIVGFGQRVLSLINL